MVLSQYPTIEDMKCSVCGKQAVGWNAFGQFCHEPDHFQTSDEFKEWTRMMQENHNRAKELLCQNLDHLGRS